MRVPLLLSLASAALSCTTDTDCWMNGVCANGACRCDMGWKGTNCSLLDLLPAPAIGAYGYSPNVSSWGGLPLQVDGKWHMHVAEMINGCGLASWKTNSRVVHVVADNMTGPYTYNDVALRDWSTNPCVVVDRSGVSPKYLLFHIGTGQPNNAEVCNGTTPEPPAPTVSSSILHVSDSPNGPWEPAPPTVPHENNPSPYIFPNGTVLLTGEPWEVWRADKWNSTEWTSTSIVWHGDPGNGTWEDPFLWWDPVRSVYKMVCHVWPSYAPDMPACDHDYSLREAGYAYSFDGVNFYRSPIPPFDNEVQHTDGSVTALSTRERPKIIFKEDGHTMLGLSNGVSSNPEPWGCKDKPGVDWTWTLVQEIRNQ
eukprot:TRINITY_DN6327_c0_g1_i4.p1 TRINITY_DN6327_c0_g1~~TRINITY_DN6327_c0_g1_i4.p1  ORF type:complete len:380 (+),score=125.87 TRINITY_DN6327_c0_g1_i4:41-1141(+)